MRRVEEKVSAGVRVLLPIERDHHRQGAAQAGERRAALEERGVDARRRDVRDAMIRREFGGMQSAASVAESAAVITPQVKVAAPHHDGGVELGRASDGHKPRDCYGAIVDVEHSIIRVLLPVLRHLDGDPPVVTLRVRRDAGHITGLCLKLGRNDKLHHRAHPTEAAAVVGAIS